MESVNSDLVAMEEPSIKHLVISGGGSALFSYFAILRESSLQGIWNIQDIETMFGTSAGAILGVLISLGYDWDTLQDYLIKRPWENVFTLKPDNVLHAFFNKGLFTLSDFRKSL